MNYKILPLVFFIFCSTNSTKLENRVPYNSKGFAYIYNINDYDNKIIRDKFDNLELQISIKALKINSLVKIINPKTNDYLVIKNFKKIDYPDFYKVLITQEVANKLNLNKDLPLVEILEIKKINLVAKKAKIFNEEKNIIYAPVTSVQISNISKKEN